jgi:hypothetical protein
MESVTNYGDIEVQVRCVRFKAGSDLSSSVNVMAVDVTDNSDSENQDITLAIRISRKETKEAV